ncbi:MAG: ThuA domain-containing protein [Limisphaerales bacterium]
MKSRIFLPLLLATLIPQAAPLDAADPAFALVYQKNGVGYVHDNLQASAAALREIGTQAHLAVEVSSDPAVFTDVNLRKYRVLIFANTNNEGFETDTQREAFQRFLRAGGGYVGIHSSTGSERSWDWFQRMQGAKFLRHPPMQRFGIRVVDRTHPATAHLGETLVWEDECYFFARLNPAIHVLLSADITSLRDPRRDLEPGGTVNGMFPLAWCLEFEGARIFYTALGHRKESFADPVFRKHLLGGIRWAMGD